MDKTIRVPVSALRISFLIVLSALVAVVFAWSSRPQEAQAVPARIAVIDVTKVLTQSNAGKAAYARLKTLQDQKMAQATQMDNDAQALEKDIQAKKLTLSEDQLTKMQQQLADKRISMQRFAQDADREIGEAKDKALADLNTKIMPVVDAMGKEMGLAAVFNKYESGLIYASDAIDITNTVVARFNTSSPTE